MEESIRNFAQQFSYKPEIIHALRFKRHECFVVVGMGGSHLGADILKMVRPDLHLYIHKDYGLPELPEQELKEKTIILSSYSGNTEEVLDALDDALKKSLSVLVITTGGTLLERAKKHSLPYIQMPQTNIQPRMALGFNFRALLEAIGDEKNLNETRELANTLNPDAIEERGKELAKKLEGSIPVLYASARNEAIALNWKIKFNETAKIPAFYNVLPELNHNEMVGFDAIESTRMLSKHFYFVILKDVNDHPRILKRMSMLEKLLRDREFPAHVVESANDTAFKKMFSSLLLADWTTYYTAKHYGLEPEQVPMVEEFKKLII